MLAATAIRDADECHSSLAARRRFVVEVAADLAAVSSSHALPAAGDGDKEQGRS